MSKVHIASFMDASEKDVATGAKTEIDHLNCLKISENVKNYE